MNISECLGAPQPVEDLGWHAGAVFFVLLASAVGVFAPLIMSRVPNAHRLEMVIIVGKHVGTGALLSLGFIHLLPPALEALGSPCLGAPWTEYPFALLFCLTAAICMHVLETLTHSHAHSHGPRGRPSVSSSSLTRVPTSASVEDLLPSAHTTGGEATTSPELVVHAAEDLTGALVLEGGLVVHSVLIGIVLGVAYPDELVALIPALSFHQLFEGFAMGSVLAATRCALWKAVALAVLYSLSAPVGVAVGIALRGAYDPNSTAALLAQGTLDAVSAGVILYAAFVTLLAYEFAHDWQTHARPAMRLLMAAALLLGAAVLSIIGIWL